MSISRLSFHYFSTHQQQIIRGIKNTEKIALANPADTCIKIFLEYQFPKTVVIARPLCVSVYPKVRLELWKNGMRIEVLDCSFADIQGTNVDKFLSVYHEFNQADSLPCDANHHSMHKKDILSFSQLQEALNIPLFLPDDWQHTCKITEESQLLIIAKESR